MQLAIRFATRRLLAQFAVGGVVSVLLYLAILLSGA